MHTTGANTAKTRETAVTGHGTHTGAKSGHHTCTCVTRDLKTAGSPVPVLYPTWKALGNSCLSEKFPKMGLKNPMILG
jgi:hypothetical protein